MNKFFSLSSTISRTNSSEGDNGQTRNLFDEVIRKNQEVTKAMLTKMAELYNRQEEYENNLAELNQSKHSFIEEIKEIAESNKNLHHEVRTANLQFEKKQTVLIDDIKKVKTGIKMPDDHVSHEEYLSSNFFKEQTHMINDRARSRKTIRNRTNIQGKVATSELPDGDERRGTLEIYRQRSTANISQAISRPIIQKEVTFDEKKSLNISTHLLKSKEEQEQIEKVLNQVKNMNSELQESVNRVIDDILNKQRDVDSMMQHLQEEMKDKLNKMSNDIERENQLGKINFEGLHIYLDNKVKQNLADKISKKYFEESLINLQDTVQAELNRVYILLEQKLSKVDLIQIDDRINELRQQIQGWNSLNSLKIQNLSYNSTCKSTPFKVNLERSSIEDHDSNNRLPRQTDDSKLKRSQLRYCNSASVIQKNEEKRQIQIEEVSEHKWKKRVMFALGTNKQHKIRRERA